MNKKLSLLLASLFLVMLTVGVACSKKEMNKEIFDDFEGDEGIYMIKLPPSLFFGMVNSESSEDVESNDIGKVDLVKILVFNQSKTKSKSTGDIDSEIKEKFSRFGYEVIIQINSGKSDISAYIFDNGDFVSDLMIVIKEDNSLVGIGLSGHLDAGAIMNFATKVDYEEMKGLLEFL